MNSYFIEHPEMVLGVLSRENTQYGRESFTVLPAEGADLADQLHEAIGHIHGVYREASLPDLGEGEALDASIPADPRCAISRIPSWMGLSTTAKTAAW